MVVQTTDRNLLFALVALQMDFITRDQMVRAMQAWMLEKSRPIGEILIARGSLSESRRQLLEPLVEEHVRQHGGDPQQSLAALSSVSDSVREELRSLRDAQLDDTLSILSPPSGDRTPPPVDSTRSVGAGTVPRGRFRILRPHAKGGLGEVSIARDEELNREVALKEIQSRYADNTEARARFVQEAEITGGLEHPGIVPVYGLGHYPDGRPFYAMRFVRGDSLKDAIERFHGADGPQRSPSEARLDLRKLLGRFIDVCEAVGYAHSRGVLHRDLKPGNIMLGRYGETLVVDWGLAKAVGRSSEESSTDEPALRPSSESGSTPTLVGSAIGTPAFMSPEQAAGQIDRIGPPSDVYSLGATLYTLLAGRPPFDARSGDVLQRVQRGEFPRPRQVRREVPAPLEAVCLKAMAVRPEDRYATPRQVAEDVEHWLADEKVIAYRDGLIELGSRLVRRHRAWAMSAAVALVLVTLVSTVAVVVINGQKNELAELARSEAEARFEAERQTAEAEAARRQAERNLGIARETVDRYLVQVAGNTLLNQPGLQRLRRDLLQSARDYYQRIADEAGDDPDSRADLGMAYGRLAEIHAELEPIPGALQLARQSISILEQLDREHPNEPTHRDHLGRSHFVEADLLRRLGQLRDSEASYRRAIELRKQLLAVRPDDPEYRRLVAACQNGLAITLYASGRFEEAEAFYLAMLEGYTALSREFPEDPRHLASVASGHYNLGLVYQSRNRIEEATESLQEASRLRESLVAKNPDVLLYRRNLVYSLNALGGLHHYFLHDLDAAERSFARAMELAQALSRENPNVIDDRRSVAALSDNLANIHGQKRQFDQALELANQGLDMWRQLAAMQPGVPEYRSNLAIAYVRQAGFLAESGDLSEALDSLQEAEAIYARGRDANPEDHEVRAKLATVAVETGNWLALSGQRKEALAKFDEAIWLLEPVMEAVPNRAIPAYTQSRAFAGKADTQSYLGQHGEARDTWARALAAAPPVLQGPLRLGHALALARQGDYEAALAEGGRVEPFADPPGWHAHGLGCLHALAAAAAHGSSTSPETPDREALSEKVEKLAQRALELLDQARDAGLYRYQARYLLLENKDLDFVRSRDEFQTLLPPPDVTPAVRVPN
ncbi:MAG: protein kinase [Pirellulaceae bacterium]